VALDNDQLRRAGFAEQDDRRGQSPVPEVLGDLPVDCPGRLRPGAESPGAVGSQPGASGETCPVGVIQVADGGQLGGGQRGATPPHVGGHASEYITGRVVAIGGEDLPPDGIGGLVAGVGALDEAGVLTEPG
jgi:hypothetical protein